jgi:parallel beta-helix repeat protein
MGGQLARILDCRSHDNPGIGIFAQSGSTISGCTTYNNQGLYGIAVGAGSVVSDSTSFSNQGKYGIYASSSSCVRDCSVYSNNGDGPENYGIYVGSGSSIIQCVASFIRNNADPATASQGVGIYADLGSTVKDCTAFGNEGDGIQVSEDCLVEGNTCDKNGSVNGDGAGIHATKSDNRIDSNNVTNNDRGIDVDIAGSFIVRNSASGNTTNYVIAAGNNVGTIQTTPIGAGAWDNFEF